VLLRDGEGAGMQTTIIKNLQGFRNLEGLIDKSIILFPHRKIDDFIYTNQPSPNGYGTITLAE